MAENAEVDNVMSLEAAVRESHGLPTNRLMMNTVLEISREIPENANNLSPEMAEYLAGRFLKGMDICGELYALAVSFEMKMELGKKQEFSNAMIIRSADRGLRTAKEKEMYAHADPEYLTAAEKYVSAKMFRLLIEEKKDAFYKAHYLLRKVADKDVGIDHQLEVPNPTLEGSTDEWSQRSTWQTQ